MEFIKKTDRFFGGEWYESEDEKYKIYKQDDQFIVRMLGATITTQYTFINARSFVETVEEAGYYKDFKSLNMQESRQLFNKGVKQFDRGADRAGFASIGYLHEPYHDITIYKHIHTKELRYDSYYIGD